WLHADKKVIRNKKPFSLFSWLFSLPGQDCFNIITIGCKTEGNPHATVEGLKNTLINHRRFSSILVLNIIYRHGEHKIKARWIPTKVKVEEHVVVPNIDQNIENLDQFLEDYTTNMAISPMDKSKALWEFRVSPSETEISHAGSVAVAKISPFSS
ncbi:hypothetical protein F2Q70_00031637, partial [Brassica cretica]